MKTARIIIWVILLVMFAGTVFAFYNVKRVVVHGISMFPTFHDKQTVFVYTRVNPDDLKIGDVIVFTNPDGLEVIKRIAFIQNRAGTLRPPKYVWTPKGQQSFQELFSDYYDEVQAGAKPKPLPEERIYVLGDNFEKSEDSRDYGPINPNILLGKVIYTANPALSNRLGQMTNSN